MTFKYLDLYDVDSNLFNYSILYLPLNGSIGYDI